MEYKFCVTIPSDVKFLCYKMSTDDFDFPWYDGSGYPEIRVSVFKSQLLQEMFK